MDLIVIYLSSSRLTLSETTTKKPPNTTKSFIKRLYLYLCTLVENQEAYRSKKIKR